MKVLLVAINAKYVHSNLAVYSLAAYARETGVDIEIGEYTINNNRDNILQAIYEEKADIVAFSCYIWNIEYVYSVAKELKKISPSTSIWLGGPEVSYDSVEVLNNWNFADIVLQGEGEETFRALVELYSRNDIQVSEEELENIKGISYRNDESEDIIQNEIRQLLDMDKLPFVYDNIDDFQNRIIYYETSRGCPFSCSYCLSSIDKSVRFRSLDIVYNELQYFLDNKVKQVKFIDRTFNCSKSHSRGIWQYILDNDNGITNFHFEVSSDLLEEEDFSILRNMREGLIQLEIGLQSTNSKAIKEIRRTMNISKLENALKTVNDMKNIHQHLDLIAGLPYEDYESFRRSFNDAYKLSPEQLQLGFLKVLKGSYIYENRDSYGLIYHDYPPYEVMATDWISYNEILNLKAVEEVLEVYYNSSQFKNTINYLEELYAEPFDLYNAIGKYYDENNLFRIQHKRIARYEVLIEFAKEKITDCNIELLKELLTYDIYLRENIKNRPEWSTSLDGYKNDFKQFFINGGNQELDLKTNSTEYDSKLSARAMHIEPVSKEALKYIDNNIDANTDIVFGVFDYESRNQLNNDATVRFVEQL